MDILKEKPKNLNEYLKEQYHLEKDIYYSIIFSIDTKKRIPIREVLPLKKYQKDHPEWLFWSKFTHSETSLEDGFKTYKYTGILNQEEFDNFCEYFGLSFDSSTLGAIGTPAYGIFELAPATSFKGDENTYSGIYYYNAYITPVLEVSEKQKEKLFNTDNISSINYEDIEEAIRIYYE